MTKIEPFSGIPRFRSSVKPTGQPPMIDLKRAAEAAAMSLRGKKYARKVTE
jgi:hypothetical protein